jgi:endonuclease/exonuclease/phosphatase family metal-dependent hydrolase
MLRLFQDQSAHLVCLQEIWDTVLFRWSDVLREEAARYGFTVHSDPIPCGGYVTNSGLAILSKLPLLDASNQAFTGSTGLQWFVPKGFQHMTFASHAAAIHVVNTHIHASAIDTALCNSPHKSIRIQQRQIMQISEHIRTHIVPAAQPQSAAAEHIPCLILAGDFNVDARAAGPDLVTQSTVPFAWLASHLRLRFRIHHMGFDEAGRNGGGVPYAVPYAVTYPFRSLPVSTLVDPDMYNYQCSLDHIFSTRPFVHQPRVLRCYDDQDQCHVSDHSPVLCSIALEPSELNSHIGTHPTSDSL